MSTCRKSKNGLSPESEIARDRVPISDTHVPGTVAFRVLVTAARCACCCHRPRDRVQKSRPNLKLKECVPNLVVSKQPDKASTM